MKELSCRNCGTAFTQQITGRGRPKSRFCSASCRDEFNTRKDSTKRFLYVIRMSGSNTICKVGTSYHPVARLQDIKNNFPFDLHMVATFPVPYGLEGEIHKKLAPYRIRGEWFQILDEELFPLIQEVLKEYLAAHPNTTGNGVGCDTMPHSNVPL